ncbi:MAG: transglutaminase domain-containing protein [Minisyncoccales bacterium]
MARPLYAATVMIFIAIFIGTASSGTAPHDQRQLKSESGETIPDALIDGIVYPKFAAPWISGTKYVEYVRPNDPIIQWFAKRVELISGKGFFFDKTGNQLKVIYISDKDAYPYADYWQDIALTGTILQGDCDDLATFVCSLLIAKGYPAMVVRGYNITTGQGHMWVEFKDNSKMYTIDFDRCLPRTSKYLGYNEDYMFNNVLERTPYDPNW